jgi:pimeloyl-ACP methyl ester carboxylesterase
MATVFVHGVPETAAIWDRVRGLIDRDSVALSLPGFGRARPDGFGATMDEYAAWLRRELDGFDEPVDLVGHDWGAILTSRVVTTNGAGLRSWVLDLPTAVSADFEWHDFAKVWQTPGEGEAFWDGLRADLDAAAGLFSSLGLPEDDARAMVGALDDTMVRSILDLYRSATNIGRDWEATGPAVPNGLVVLSAADPFGGLVRWRAMAERLGADFEVIEGGGHWWPYDNAESAAATLQAFWGRVD